MFVRDPIAAIAFVGSVAVHASVVVGMSMAPPTAQPQPAATAEIEVAVASLEPPAALADPIEEPTPAAGANEAASSRAVAAALAASRPRASAPRRLPSAADPGRPNAAELAPSSPEGDGPSTPPRFVMSVGAATPSGPASAPSGRAIEEPREPVYGEEAVDARPRLLAWQAPRYPPMAASAGVEVDVPVDVVIDTEGLVTDVRLPEHLGYGLDEAAIATARSYRFSRGLKRGHAVSVRMRCTVMFRLN